jgi:hypothetical protein
MGWTVRGSNPSGGEIFRTHSHRPWGPPSLLYNGYRLSFLGVKQPGHRVDHPPPSCAEVKDRVELHLDSSSWPSWPVLGWTLLFIAIYMKVSEDTYFKLLVHNTYTTTFKPSNTGSLLHLVTKLGQKMSSKLDPASELVLIFCISPVVYLMFIKSNPLILNVYTFHSTEKGIIRSLPNSGTYLNNYNVSHPRTPQSPYSLRSKSHFSQ